MARPRKVVVFISSDAGGMTCECGEKLAHYELRHEGERPKTILCCTRASCDNSAKTTAKIHHATLEV